MNQKSMKVYLNVSNLSTAFTLEILLIFYDTSNIPALCNDIKEVKNIFRNNNPIDIFSFTFFVTITF